jgi:hypothetical protein
MGVRNRVDRVAARGHTSGVVLVAGATRIHGGITGYQTGYCPHPTRFLSRLANIWIGTEPAQALASKGSWLDTRSTRLPAAESGRSARLFLWALIDTT